MSAGAPRFNFMFNPRQLALPSGTGPLLDSPLVGEPDAARAGAAVDALAPVLILGVGNVLMGDEGVGVQILRRLEREQPIAGVRLLDGGTGGVNLLAEFEGVAVVILIDATRDGKPAGTVTYLEPKRVGELPRGLGAHDFGLKDLFAAAALLGRLPELHLYTIAVEEVRPMCTELSLRVASAIGPVVASVRIQAAQLADDYLVRDALSLRKASAARTWPTDAQL